MMVLQRRTDGTMWHSQILDKDHSVVRIIPGAFHAILNMAEKPSYFVAVTVRGHLVRNELGGNVYRLEVTGVPPEVKDRIDTGHIQ